MSKWFLLWVMLIATANLSAQYSTSSPSEADVFYSRGMAYSFAGLLAKDINKAKALFQQSANLGNAKSMKRLGEIYSREKDYLNADSAIYWYTKSIENGDNDAIWNMGAIYQYGLQHIQQDFIKAATLFQKGAELNHTDCLLSLAYLYYKGMGVKQNYQKAITIFETLAASGNAMAQYYSGTQYRNGYGVVRDLNKADYYLTAAANQGYKQAILEKKAANPENPIDELAIPSSIKLVGDNGYKRIKHNMKASALNGSYKGYAIRYDFSGKNVLSIFPIEASLTANNSTITGLWKEADGEQAEINAYFTDSALIFKNTVLHKIDHNSTQRGGENWDFRNAVLNMAQEMDSTFITGNIQLYSQLRNEPGMPLFIYLSRVTSNLEKKQISENAITVSANNPFHQVLNITFNLPVQSSVIIKLSDMNGNNIFSERTNSLHAGTYTKGISVSSLTAAGSYVLTIETKEGKSVSKVLIKQ